MTKLLIQNRIFLTKEARELKSNHYKIGDSIYIKDNQIIGSFASDDSEYFIVDEISYDGISYYTLFQQSTEIVLDICKDVICNLGKHLDAV